MHKWIAFLAACSFSVICALGQPTYYIQGLMRQPSAPAARKYLGITGTGGGAEFMLLVNEPTDNGTNFVIDMNSPASILQATGGIALRGSFDWPGNANTTRCTIVYVAPTNYSRQVFVYDAATNWNLAGLGSPYTLPGGTAAWLRACIFGQGETNIVATFTTGSAVASGGETYFNPNGVPGLVLWLDAARNIFAFTNGTGTVANGGVLQYWGDLSGNGNNVTNRLSTDIWNQFGAPNSLPCVQFLGSATASNLRSLPFPMATGNWTFLVYTTPGNSAGAVLDGLAIQTLETALVVANWQFIPGATFATATSLGAGSDWVLVSTHFNGANSVCRTNGVQAVTVAAANSTPSGFTVGDRGGLGSPLNGKIAEILVYNAALSSLNMSNIENYLMTKYSITP